MMISMLLGTALLASPAPKDVPPMTTKVLATTSGGLAGARGGATQIIRSEEELNKATGMDATKAAELLARRLKVDKIDFSKQMIIVIHGGTRPTGGYSVEVTSLEVKDKELIVKWKVNAPGPNQPVTQAFTNPAVTVLADKFEGKITFDPLPKEAKDRVLPKRGIDDLRPRPINRPIRIGVQPLPAPVPAPQPEDR